MKNTISSNPLTLYDNLQHKNYENWEQSKGCMPKLCYWLLFMHNFINNGPLNLTKVLNQTHNQGPYLQTIERSKNIFFGLKGGNMGGWTKLPPWYQKGLQYT